jgi:hypothetical protein
MPCKAAATRGALNDKRRQHIAETASKTIKTNARVSRSSNREVQALIAAIAAVVRGAERGESARRRQICARQRRLTETRSDEARAAETAGRERGGDGLVLSDVVDDIGSDSRE